MNVNNIFGGILGFVIAMSLTFLFWTPVDSFIDGITTTNSQLGIALSVAWISFLFIINILVPINLATSDDTGEQ